MKKNITVSIAIFILLASLMGCQPEQPNSPLSAALSELTGTVAIKQAGQAEFSPANAEATLEADGQVQTGDDGRVRLDLSSGTIIRIAPSSLFTLTSNQESNDGLLTNIKLELGKIFIILNGGQADVETPSGVASVRGSYMKVEVDPITKDIYITCLEGNCSASNPAGAVNFTNGESVVLYAFDENTGTWSAPNVEPMTPEQFQEWLDNNPEARELYEQAMGTATALAQITEEPSPEPTEELQEALPPSGASNACFEIIQPASGSALPKIGQVTFEWTPQDGAEKYIITFVDKNGNKATIGIEDGTSLTQYIEVLPNGGEYEWFITAVGADNNEICSTSSNSFSKPQGDPTAKPSQGNNDGCNPCDPLGACYDFQNPICTGCSPADICNPNNSVCYNPDAC
jgi:hypothetical protein